MKSKRSRSRTDQTPNSREFCVIHPDGRISDSELHEAPREYIARMWNLRGVPSARDVGVNLAYRWFCGLSIEDKIPDHSAFSRARNERFRDSGIFRSVFERVVGACIGAGLVGGEGFAVDASLIVADANKQRSTPGPRWNKELDAEAVSRATKEYLATLDDAAFGAASDVAPKFVSPSDPAAQWTGPSADRRSLPIPTII